MTPERSVTVSPVAASSSGVATRTAAARNPPTSTGSIRHAARRDHAALRRHAVRAALGEQHDDDPTASTTYTATAGTPASRCIAPAPASSAPNRMPGDHHAERMQPAEQRDRDRGEAVARREVLEQRVGDAADLDAAGEPGDRARQASSATAAIRRLSIRPLISAARGPSADGAEPEAPQRAAEEIPERHRAERARAAGRRAAASRAAAAAAPTSAIGSLWG